MIYKYIHEPDYKVKQEWIKLQEVNKSVPLALIASEDQLFIKHTGFDIVAIKSAIEKNKKRKKVVGASTISQQVAKNVFLIPTRNFLRKGLEAYFTILIEWIWGKERIMEVYVNVIELGPGIYGVEQAAQTYFKKSAKKLSWNEAALIAVALPNPIRYRLSAPSSYMYQRKNWVLRQMNNLGGETLVQDWYNV